MKTLAVLAVLSALAGCAAENVRVSCEGRLQPINPPAAAQKPAAPLQGDVSKTASATVHPEAP